MKSFVCRVSRRLQHQLHRFPLQRAGREQTRLACSGCRERSSPQYFGISRPQCFCFCFPSQKKKKTPQLFHRSSQNPSPFLSLFAKFISAHIWRPSHQIKHCVRTFGDFENHAQRGEETGVGSSSFPNANTASHCHTQPRCSHSD